MSSNFQTRPNGICASIQKLTGVGHLPGNRRRGDGRGRGHENAGGRIAHPPLEIACARRDAGLARSQHAHMTTLTRTAGGIGHDGSGVDQHLDDARLQRPPVDRLRTGRDDEADAGRDFAARDHFGGDGKIVEIAVGARSR